MNDKVSVKYGPSREVTTNRPTDRGPAYGTVSRGRFDTPNEDIWGLFVDPERLQQWNPDTVTGEFHLGGTFSVENNASGEILRCEPPTMFRVTWIYEVHYSELEVRMGSIGDDTVVEIEHLMVEEEVTAAGMSLREGLAASGAGWDLALDHLGGIFATWPFRYIG